MTLPCSVLLVFCSSASFAATNIIDTTYGTGAGSFELGAFSENSGNSGNYMRLPINSTAIIGWTVGGADGIDWITGPSNPAAQGTFGIDLAGIGHFQASSSGSISTTIPTTIGVSYQISFESYIQGPDPVTGRLTAGDLDEIFSSAGISDPSAPTYTPFQYSFTALSTETIITFSTSNSGGFGPVIDNVVVSVPEPQTYLAFSIGLLATSMFRSRRSRPRTS